MCFGGGPRIDNSAQQQQQREAAEARRREEERAARIRAGTQQVEDQFSQFDDSFFGDRRDAFMGYYQPQIDDQFRDARDQLTFALARSGNLRGSAAADRQTRLGQDYELQRASVVSRADEDVQRQQDRIAGEKSSLISQLNATGDADRIGNEATARTRVIAQDRPSFDPLGDIFAGVTSGIGAAMQGGFQQGFAGGSPLGGTTRQANKGARLIT